MSKKTIEENLEHFPMDRRRILVVGDRGFFSPNIISHSVHLAGRLGFDLVALSVESGWDGPRRDSKESIKTFLRQASQSGIRCDHISRAGDPGAEVAETIQKIRRVEFVVMDAETSPVTIREVTLPVVSVSSGPTTSRGGKEMAETPHGHTKRGQIARTVGFGLMTAGLYAAVFTNTQTVMQYFTKGGWYAALPIATVFLFSYVHGTFASNLWSLLGIDAMRKDRVRETERKVIEKKKTLRKRPRMYAYVNPFHRIDK